MSISSSTSTLLAWHARGATAIVRMRRSGYEYQWAQIVYWLQRVTPCISPACEHENVRTQLVVHLRVGLSDLRVFRTLPTIASSFQSGSRKGLSPATRYIDCLSLCCASLLRLQLNQSERISVRLYLAVDISLLTLVAEFEFRTNNPWLRACIYLENTEGKTASGRI